jgi:hypothetical protein
MSCVDCGRRYGDEYGFPDLLIETWAWKRISPSGDESGLLCPSCICARLHIEGISCMSAFVSGPLAVREDPPWALKERLLRLEEQVG